MLLCAVIKLLGPYHGIACKAIVADAFFAFRVGAFVVHDFGEAHLLRTHAARAVD